MDGVGRKRTTDRDLPRYWKRSHGAIYLIVPRKLVSVGKPGSWIRLGATEEEAHRTYADLLAGERAGTYQQLFDRYEAEVLSAKAPRTRQEQGRQLRRFGAWCGHMPLGSLTSDMTQDYVDRRPPVAGNRELSLLTHVCKKGMRWRLLRANPCAGVERHKEDPQQELADPLSMMLAWRAAKPWMRAMMAIDYVIGQRRGDVRKIRDTDFDFRGLSLEQGKTETKLLLTWTPNLRAARDYALSVRQATPIARWLICTPRGQRISESTFRREWARVRREVAKAGGTPFMFKSLRTTSATDHATGAHLGHQDERTLRKHYRKGPRVEQPI